MLLRPGPSLFSAWQESSFAGVRVTILPASAGILLQAGTAPSAVDILQGQGAGGQGVAAAGNMTRSGSLPWESGGAPDRRKLWASVTGLQSGISYTVCCAALCCAVLCYA